MIDLYQANINSSENPGYIHPEVARLQHLLHQREIQQRDFMEAFTGKHHIHVHVIYYSISLRWFQPSVICIQWCLQTRY